MSLGNKNWQDLIDGGGGATIGGGQQMRHPRWHFPGPARQFLLRISAVARIVRQFLRMHARWVRIEDTCTHYSTFLHMDTIVGKQAAHTFESEGCIVKRCGDL